MRSHGARQEQQTARVSHSLTRLATAAPSRCPYSTNTGTMAEAAPLMVSTIRTSLSDVARLVPSLTSARCTGERIWRSRHRWRINHQGQCRSIRGGLRVAAASNRCCHECLQQHGSGWSRQPCEWPMDPGGGRVNADQLGLQRAVARHRAYSHRKRMPPSPELLQRLSMGIDV